MRFLNGFLMCCIICAPLSFDLYAANGKCKLTHGDANTFANHAYYSNPSAASYMPNVSYYQCGGIAETKEEQNVQCNYGDLVIVWNGIKECKQSTEWEQYIAPTCKEQNEEFLNKYIINSEYDVYAPTWGTNKYMHKKHKNTGSISDVCVYDQRTYDKLINYAVEHCTGSGGSISSDKQPKNIKCQCTNEDLITKDKMTCACKGGKLFDKRTKRCIEAPKQQTEQSQTQTGQDSLQEVPHEPTQAANECELGKKDEYGFYMCDGNNGCDKDHHPNHATKWACTSVGRTCNVCVAKDCDTEKGYTLTQGYCKYDPNAKAEKGEEPPVVESTEGDASKICSDSGGTPNANGGCDCDGDKRLKPTGDDPAKCECIYDGYEFDATQNKCVNQTTIPQLESLKIDELEGTEFSEEEIKKLPVNPIPVIDPEAEKKAELEEKLKTAQAALDKAKEKENSWANRGLTAASTAAAGLGTMQLAEGIAEQRADSAAETDMRAYMATMKCNYGNGQNITAGNEEIFLPGGNELSKLYAEYKTLADNLKITKAALGLRPGIESEVLYDRAESGLYKNASTGKTGGAYTSLSRAMTDSESEDAAAWAEQKQTASKKLKAGGITAGTGVVGGAIGDYLINERDTDDSKK